MPTGRAPHGKDIPPGTEQTTVHRSRTFSWADPAAAASAGAHLSGLAYLRELLAGALPLPPMVALLGMRLAEVAEGRVVFTVVPEEFHYNPIGSVHGGLAATLLDSAMGCAVHSCLPEGVGYTTLTLNVTYLRPLTHETGEVRGEGTTIHVGGRIAMAEARVVDAAGRLYAHATSTCMVLRSDAQRRETR